MLFHVLRHIDSDDGVFTIKKSGGESFGELGLSDSCGPQKKERADGSLRIFQAGAGTDHGVCHSLNGFVLSDDSFVENGIKPQEFVFLTLQESSDRNSCPAGDYLAYLLSGYFLPYEARLGVFLLILGFGSGLRIF